MKPLAQNTLIQNRYLIVHLIGKGGMGEVYLAVDQRLGSAVALKRTFFAGDDMLGNAFEREARTLARMRHPVLPKVSDHFGENDEQYLVMEHIAGDDLSKRLDAAGKPFPVSWVLFWADQLLDALSYLHTHEPPIIHRDIKPQNLKLTDENHIILLDFGLSKTSTGQTNISQSGSTGSVVGYTPHYAPMEQIRGIGTSPRSDLYSLSATLYQLLTNTIPVDALSRADAMLNGLPDPIVPPHEINPEVPAVVSEVLLRGMEVSQEKRYANAREMQRVLRKAFNEIQQATSANTVAFSPEEAEAMRSVIPASVPGAQVETGTASSTSDSGASIPQESKAIQPDAGIDLEATMAYDPFEPDSKVKQSEVRTEVFSPGSDSIPHQGTTEPPVAPYIVERENYESRYEGDSAPSEGASGFSEPVPFSPGATVPYVALDEARGEDSLPSGPGSDSVSAPEFFDSEEYDSQDRQAVPAGFSSVEAASVSVPEENAYATAVASQPVPHKRSSGKMLAVVGGLAAIVLLGAAIGGGIWAYMQFVPSTIDPDPTPQPSPEETILATPSPAPTVESLSNADNTNVDVPSNTNTNEGIIVDPTPERVPEQEPVTRPTSRPVQTPRPAGTPVPRSTPRRTPVARPTVMP